MQVTSMNYKSKKILILGLGLNEGGVGAARFFVKRGAKVLVTDIKSKEELGPSIDQLKEFPEIKYHLGGHKNEDIEWADLIIRNQAIKPDNPFLKYARELGKQIEMDMGIFLQFADSKKIIGVTGTKGKSTTSSMIYEMLKAGGKKVVFGGNIGKSVLDLIDIIYNDDLIVLELSSFQLEAWDEHQVAPHIAVITNIFPDHLNYYPSFEHYKDSKKLIGKHQTGNDFLIISKNDPNLSAEFLANLPGKLIFVSPEDLGENFNPKLIGGHNRQNFAAALKVAEILEIDKSQALKALEEFSGVPFRLELIKDWRGIKIYNNTTATGPEPAIESLRALPGCILIAGGMNKGLKYEQFAKAINLYTKSLYLLEGDASTEIDSLLQEMKSSKVTTRSYNDLEDLLLDVKAQAKEGDIILFSPGATSFNLFQNEFDRGRKFNEAVEKVFA